MGRDASFWRNVTIIGIVHVVALCALVRWGGVPAKVLPSNIVWMDGGVGGHQPVVAAITDAMPTAPSDIPPPGEREDFKPPDEQMDTAFTSAVHSDIVAATATPSATPTATASPTARPKRSSKPRPKATPTPKPKKTLLAKASATPSRPKPSAAPAVEEQPTEQEPKEPSPAPSVSTDVVSAIAAAAKTGTMPTVGISGPGAGGTGGSAAGPGGASQFGWYAHMLHDRFFSQWAQPTSVVRSGAKMSTLVKLRIEKDGHVSRFTVLKPSGNVVVDESVVAVGKRVKQVEPLPGGLGDSYEVNINFELNSEQ